jgi:hypothetical protein
MRRLGRLAGDAEVSSGTVPEGEPAVVDIVSVQFFPVGIIIPADKIVSSDIFLHV